MKESTGASGASAQECSSCRQSLYSWCQAVPARQSQPSTPSSDNAPEPFRPLGLAQNAGPKFVCFPDSAPEAGTFFGLAQTASQNLVCFLARPEFVDTCCIRRPSQKLVRRRTCPFGAPAQSAPESARIPYEIWRCVCSCAFEYVLLFNSP